MKYMIWRRCPRTGFVERIFYEGHPRDQPKGWKRCMFNR